MKYLLFLLLWSGFFQVQPVHGRAELTCADVTDPIMASDTAMLIEAINCANADPDTNIINLTNSIYSFYSASELDTALPRIVNPIIINGNGATLERASEAPDFRLLRVDGGSLILDQTVLENGGIYNAASILVMNTVITGSSGAGIDNTNNLTVINSTITGNGAGISGSSTPFTVVNTIIWNNSGFSVSGAATVNYSVIQGGYAGDGNLDTDPLFFNAASDDYRLHVISPAINAGDTTALPAGGNDLGGNPRIQENVIDIGAYEQAAIPGVTAVADELNVSEEGTTDSYSIVMNSMPSADVTITMSSTQVSAGPITFAPANWNTPQTVTITAIDDDFVEGTHDDMIVHSVTSDDHRYNNAAINNLFVTITDNDAVFTELLSNPGFENHTVKASQPDKWNGKLLTKDRLKCNTDAKTFSYNGECAYHFFGVVGESAQLSQVLTRDVQTGTTLESSVYYRANTKPSLKMKLKVFYIGVAQPAVTKGAINTVATEYTEFSLAPYTITGELMKMKLQFNNAAASGKIYLDDASVGYSTTLPR